MLVDDDQSMIREVVARYLEVDDVIVAEACNGAEAIEWLDSNTSDLIVLDVMLPEVDGLTILRRLRLTTAAAGVHLVDPGAVYAIASPAALTRIIRNPIDNGIRHAPPGTQVTVHISSEGAATVRVSDVGPGFPSDFRESAFEGFSCADVSRSRNTGTVGGLGLAIARGLVEAQGGEIWIEDCSPTSVAFRVPLPA